MHRCIEYSVAAIAICFALLAAGLAGPSNARADTAPIVPGVVLGIPGLYPYGSGWGTERPTSVSNGGVPGGNSYDLTWKNWGGPVAYGEGKTSLYRPSGNYYASPGKLKFRASAIGVCAGSATPAYTQLEVRLAHWPGGPLGEWFPWARLSSTCEQAWLPYTGSSPGFCGGTSSDGWKKGYDVRSYRYGCSRSLSLSRKVNKRISMRCISRGCTIRESRFKCRVYPNTGSELSGGEFQYPIHRIACKRGTRNVSWHHLLHYD